MDLRSQLPNFDRDRARYHAQKLASRNPDDPAAMSLRGRLLIVAGDIPAGAQLIRQAFARRPNDKDITCDYVAVCFSSGQKAAGLEALHNFQAHTPDLPDILSLLLQACLDLQRWPEALVHSQRLIEVQPDDINAISAHGARLQTLRRYDQAIATLEGGLARRPGSFALVGTLLLTMLYAGKPPGEIRDRAKAYWAAAPLPPPLTKPGTRRSDAGGRVRVGYIGPSFHRNVVLHFTEGIYREHDRARFFLAMYDTTRSPDSCTQRVSAYADLYRNVWSLPPEQLARTIHDDRIDILIDLAGFTAGSALQAFAHQPAPVQVSYLGFPATTGLPTIGHRITDAIADPPSSTTAPRDAESADSHCTESLLRLPRCAWAYTRLPEDLPPQPLPTPTGPLHLASFNILSKVSPATTRLWARALAACPTATLMLTDRGGLLTDPDAAQQLSSELLAAGAGAPRLTIEPFQPTSTGHRARFALADVQLDPLSYNGTTTTAELLPYGIPTLTLPGNSHVSRVGASLLSAAGLPEYVANDESDFVARIASLANDPDALRQQRDVLRDRLQRSPLADFKSLTRALEAAFSSLLP
jgi:protein O-GlcNAc transferase